MEASHKLEQKQRVRKCALAGVAQWIVRGLQTKGLPVRFPVRVHAWVVGHMRGNHVDIFLSLLLSPSLSLSKNK